MSLPIVKRLSRELTPDFFTFHDNPNGCGWCYCVAWWMESWQGFMQRTAAQNRSLREELFLKGVVDGYLLYLDRKPSGWCQVTERDDLKLLAQKYSLPAEERVWAVTCFLVAPTIRRKGFARLMLDEVIKDLRSRGGRALEAFPNAKAISDPDELWVGPLELYQAAGFRQVKQVGDKLVLRLEL